MSVNRATMQGAFDLCELFQKEGVPSIIAGGAARDIYFGVTPKDRSEEHTSELQSQ